MKDKISINIIKILEQTLGHVEPNLINHGSRVAYLTYKMLKHQNACSYDELRDSCIIALLHDIGAYKTEELSQMLNFEAAKIWEHSIYGGLFIKYFSPLHKYAPVLYFHHADVETLQGLEPEYHNLAQIIFLADRLDIISRSHMSTMEIFHTFLNNTRNKLFKEEILDLLVECGIDFLTFPEDLKKDKEFQEFLYQQEFTEREIYHYIDMLVLSIDFRSPQTVTHTFAVSGVSELLAKKLNMSEDEISRIHYAAMLHDLGKTSTPVSILENPSKLTPEEMNIMREHVVITDTVLKDNIDDDIRLMAARHHEKLNGKGYPDGLTGESLTTAQRLVAVADIFSALCGVRSYKKAFSKEKIVSIITDMMEQQHLDSHISQLALDHYDEIIQEVEKISAPLIETYTAIQQEYEELLKKLDIRR